MNNAFVDLVFIHYLNLNWSIHGFNLTNNGLTLKFSFVVISTVIFSVFLRTNSLWIYYVSKFTMVGSLCEMDNLAIVLNYGTLPSSHCNWKLWMPLMLYFAGLSWSPQIVVENTKMRRRTTGQKKVEKKGERMINNNNNKSCSNIKFHKFQNSWKYK